MQKHPSPLYLTTFEKVEFPLLFQSSQSGLPRRADEAEAVVVVPAVGVAVVPARDGTVWGVVVPTAATKYPVTAGIRSCRILCTTGIAATAVPVPAPLVYIATHVIKPQGIGLLFTYLMGLAVAVITVPSHIIRCVAAAVYVVPTAVCNPGFASPGSIFPFRLCREPVAVGIKITGYSIPICII